MTRPPEIAKAQAVFEHLREHSSDPPGVTRTSYGEGENFAHRLIAEWAQELALEVTHDYAGNQYATLPGRDRAAPRVVMGSHMDSVHHGGNYDGAAGVVCGMAALHRLRRLGRRPDRDLAVMAIRAEEIVWFPCHYAGSRMAFGLLDSADYDRIRRSDSGRTLAEHIDELGFDSDALKAGNAWLRPDDIHCYIEVHAVFAGQGVPSAMLFIRNDGGSHNPEESMEMEDFELAADVLGGFLDTTFCAADE